MRSYLHRHQPPLRLTKALLAGLGGGLAIAVLGLLTLQTGYALLMAPFGASCVLLFSQPFSPLSQPLNVFFGHVVSAAVGLLLCAVLPNTWWAVALAVGAAIALMAALRVTHPPAGANPLVIFSLHPGVSFLCLPVALGALALIICAVIFHRLSGQVYPLGKSD
ncbi:HPP family protein [Rhizobium sp.]|uniref:HPP family protein n=1 Tax=Rhizobium sp. TaxID=391 RepID=UPI000E847871|nr:HPP family protein [Rhizobium sp.]